MCCYSFRGDILAQAEFDEEIVMADIGKLNFVHGLGMELFRSIETIS